MWVVGSGCTKPRTWVLGNRDALYFTVHCPLAVGGVIEGTASQGVLPGRCFVHLDGSGTHGPERPSPGTPKSPRLPRRDNTPTTLGSGGQRAWEVTIYNTSVDTGRSIRAPLQGIPHKGDLVDGAVADGEGSGVRGGYGRVTGEKRTGRLGCRRYTSTREAPTPPGTGPSNRR